MDERWQVPWAASCEESTLPRSRVARNEGPNIVRAAVEPMATTRFGLTSRSSAASHGRQAAVSREFGFLCFTALVT